MQTGLIGMRGWKSLSNLQLSYEEQQILTGSAGPAMATAMSYLVHAAEMLGAPKLIPASFLHIDACHYYGQVHLDFAEHLLKQGAKFSIPAWTNTLTVNLQGKAVRPNTPDTQAARRLAALYCDMGANPVWTCAPYQLPGGPVLGDQIIGSESNAVGYYNSVVGARTNKYGDFLEVCAGLVARVPYMGLHTDTGRRGQVLVDLGQLEQTEIQREGFCEILGLLIGRLCGKDVPVIVGMPETVSKDALKGLAATAAASGDVSLFHVVGVTPEAPTLEAAFADMPPDGQIVVTRDLLADTKNSLTTTEESTIDCVMLGTPHFSAGEFEQVVRYLGQDKVHPDIRMVISTSRYVANAIDSLGWLSRLERAGIEVITDTCTYFSPALEGCSGSIMTNSGKYAYYAPGMLETNVVFGSLKECVESAKRGEVRRMPEHSI